MKSEDKETRGISRLHLGSLETGRRTLARFIKARNADQMDSGKYRDLIYGMAHLLQYFKTETLENLAKRIEAIENDSKSA